VSKLMNPEPAC